MRSLFPFLLVTLASIARSHAAPIALDDLLPGARDEADAGAVEASEARVGEARATRGPTLHLELEGGTSRGEIVRIPGTETYVHGTSKADDATLHGRYGVRLRLDGLVTDFGRTSARIDAAKHGRDAAVAERDASRASREAAIASAFFAWAAADARAAAARAEHADAIAAAARVHAAVDRGERPAADLDGVELAAAQAALEESRGVQVREQARAALEAIVGPLAADATPAVTVAAPLVVRPVRSPEQRAAKARLAAAQAEARASELTFRPVITYQVDAGASGIDDRAFPDWEAGVALRVPLWDGSLDARRREARARARIATAEGRAEAQREQANRRAAASALTAAEERVALAGELGLRAERLFARASDAVSIGGESLDSLAALDRARTQLRGAKLEQSLATIDLAAARRGLPRAP